MPNVLIISRQFPPIGSVGGSIRLIKQLKFINSDYWKFFIYTQDPQRQAVTLPLDSKSLITEIPSSASIYRFKTPISIPNKLNDKSIFKNIASVVWSINIIKECLKLTKHQKFAIIFTPMPYTINAFIGLIIRMRKNIPLIIDMKDDYVGGQLYLQKSKLRKKIDNFLEFLFIKYANHVIFATEESFSVYSERYPDKQNKFSFIPNGVDLDEFNFVYKKRIIKNKFLIINAASRYHPDYRDALPILQTLNFVFHQKHDLKNKIEVIFLGNSLSDCYFEMITKLGLKDNIKNISTKDRSEYIQWLSYADLFLLIQPKNNFTSISGTVYEYWASGNAPVLLFSENGSTKNIIENYNIGRGFHYSEIIEASNYILSLIDNSDNGMIYEANTESIKNFDRKNLAKKIEVIWNGFL